MIEKKLKEEIVISKDGKTVTHYKLITKIIDLEALRKQLKSLENEKPPSKDEIIQLGKSTHSYFNGREARIEKLRRKIEKYGN